MARKKKPLPIFRNVTITDIAAEGKSLVRITIPEHDGTAESQLVTFVPWCVPGDVVDLQIRRKKNSYAEAEVIRFHKYSKVRETPMCQHFGVCGGCKWQNLPYEEQLKFKEKQVYYQLTRIGHLTLPLPGSKNDDETIEFRNILGSVKTREYRNKLDFGAANKRYLTKEEIASLPPSSQDEEGGVDSAKNLPALGFHITGAFDKILPIEECHLMDDINNRIRNGIRDYAYAHSLTFFDARVHTGLLRGMMIRLSNTEELMLLMQFCITNEQERQQAEGMLQWLHVNFPEVSSLLWVNNTKFNDTFNDLPVERFSGTDHIFLQMENLRFKVGPKSFYQTNTDQAYILYKVARDFAQLTGSELVYDLYTGTGTIANFVARQARQVIGIEYVPEAIEDAKVNSQLNGIENTLFFAGDMKDILNRDFIQQHGRPDVIITDPPRAGMHQSVVDAILFASPQRIVYVSCNPATQARDLQLLDEQYQVSRIQPVDMFPHTQHVENVVLLTRR